MSGGEGYLTIIHVYTKVFAMSNKKFRTKFMLKYCIAFIWQKEA
ncbi:hypothetical protein BTHERMOSOX_946 [Bathymodiolus thermophilus thioautotrophic gill symbiont]|nr:hypothetical protein BTHERMOSOX_946 [Bathymodiolus thermophilus thioautotrophic gill symbiont]